MSGLFGISPFNQDIGAWDVSNVTNISNMFEDAVSFSQDLSKWCVQNISSTPSHFAMRAGFEQNLAFYPIWGTCP